MFGISSQKGQQPLSVHFAFQEVQGLEAAAAKTLQELEVGLWNINRRQCQYCLSGFTKPFVLPNNMCASNKLLLENN